VVSDRGFTLLNAQRAARVATPPLRVFVDGDSLWDLWESEADVPYPDFDSV
jgi:hypothetical protein